MSHALWPALFGGALALTWLGQQTEHGLVWFVCVYFLFAMTIGIAERLMPFERAWLEDDRQTFANLAHTVLNKGVVQGCFAVIASVGVASVVQPDEGIGEGLWPAAWPLAAQVLLGLVIAEFGFYWAHRLSHELPLLWRFHAVHHSVTRLWFINTGRFHFVDSAVSIVMSQPLLYLVGAPVEIFFWVGAVTAFIGMLTHCNIDTRTGPLNWLFNTPGLHRWHHSMRAEEGNTNYGENLMIWDHLFGTFFNPPRRPPAVIGIHSYMPANFVGQLAHPFRKDALAPVTDDGAGPPEARH